MIDPQLAAWVFGACTGVAALFQLALSLGAPWGHLAMGGRFPGRLPPAMRIGAVLQIAVYAALAGIVLVRAGLALPQMFEPSRAAVWIVVALMSLSVVLNLVTPSRWERRLWAPVTIAMLAASLRVALD